MLKTCDKCNGEGILNEKTGESVDYFSNWREDGTEVAVCDKCDGKLVLEEREILIYQKR